MKIIRHGTLPPKERYKGECLKCGCFFECSIDDAVFTTSGGPGKPVKVTVQCPTSACCTLIQVENMAAAE